MDAREEIMKTERARFTPEFKEEAVRLVLEGSRPIAQVARQLAINEGTLGNWVAKFRDEHPVSETPLTLSERQRLAGLEREVRQVKLGNEVLGVWTSGFYAWRERPASPTATRRAQIAQAAAAAHEESDGTFGYRRVHSQLAARGTVLSGHPVRRARREQDLHGG